MATLDECSSRIGADSCGILEPQWFDARLDARLDRSRCRRRRSLWGGLRRRLADTAAHVIEGNMPVPLDFVEQERNIERDDPRFEETAYGDEDEETDDAP